MFKSFDNEKSITTEQPRELETLNDLKLKIEVKIGEVYVTIEDLLKSADGGIFILNKDENAVFDVLANGKKISDGTLIVVDGKLAVKISGLKKGGQ